MPARDPGTHVHLPDHLPLHGEQEVEVTVAQVQEMVQECDVRKAPTCWGNTTGYDGIHLIYAAGNPGLDPLHPQATAMLPAASPWSSTVLTPASCCVGTTLYMAKHTR